MGCGKSVIGALLAKRLQVPFYDLDQEIENETQKSITELFQTRGEIYFRKKENKILNNLLDKKEPFILSLGGGTPCYHNNHELLIQEGVFSVYLKASVDTLVSRLFKEKTKRPLLHDLDEVTLKDFITKHLFDRNFYYHQATKIVNVDDKSVQQILNEIEALLI